KEMEKELESIKARFASSSSGDLIGAARTSPRGIKVIAEKVECADVDLLRSMVDKLRTKLGSGVVALGANQGKKAIIIAGITQDLSAKLNASDILKEVTKLSGGK